MRQIIQVLASTFLFFIIFGSFSSSFAQEKAAPVFPSDAYVATVTTSILPIMEAPGMRYNLSKNTLDWSEGLEGTVVYGNMLVVRPSSKKDWVELLSNENGESLGFVPLKGLSKTQPYESTPYTWYVVAKDNAELSLEPDVKQKGSPLASFKLIKGELVPSFGKRGTKLLLRFDTLNSESGIGARYAWADEGDFILLSNYQPASGEFDPSWLPSAIRCLGYGDGEEGKGICPAVTVPKNISSGLQSHGFYIDGTPVIIDVIDDDMGDSYLNIHNQQPVFISTDIFLHYFHLIFNRLLETLELASLEPGLEENLKAAISQLNSISSNLTPNLLGPWQTAVDMFSVPSSLLSEKSGTVPLSPKASKEVTLIKEATVVGMPSPVFETLTDYTMFKPRGHYTKSPVLSRYFLAMNYIGTAELMLFDLKGDPITPNIQTAALICMTLDSLGDKWLSLEEPIDYLIGASNTGDGKKFRALVKQHIGTLNDPTSLVKLSDPNALTALSDSIKKEIEGPQIQSVAGVDKPGEDFSERSPVFRISGKRFSLDAFIFNQLTTPRVGTPELSRAMPKGTDVMAILGSEVASQYAEKNFDIPNYRENYQLLKQLAPGILSKDKTVYSLWLSAFQAGFKNSGADYFFYKDNLWSYKKLLTALASYAEIKHDTILYVEQSMSELGDGMLMAGDFAPPFPRGFVEPDPQVYQAILTATDALKNFIQKYDLETPRKKDTSSDNSNMMAGSISFLERLTEFSRLLTLARDISIKEVSGKELAIKDYEAIQELGGSFTGTLNLGFQNNYSQGDAQRMALIADAASSSDDVLELATGTPRKVFVYVNDKWGGSRITMGYVFSYYEFVRPISEGRLNDEEWKKIVYDKNAQQKLEKLRPAWYQNLVY